jgi:hypothetical protein
MELAFEDWMVALSALIFGVGIGWLIWGGRRNGEVRRHPVVETPAAPAELVPVESAPGASVEGQAGNPAGLLEGPAAPQTDDPARLDKIETELKDARELLSEGEEELRLFGEEIAELDSAIKRANGRLRLLIREIRRRALGGPGLDEDE